ncbi:MAG: ABC-F family ATP-binding cassette domain-containing protein [Parachlamydiales bacterium]|jgi:ATPase subunit of ABC transporter with duplicated ATPase domains
MSRLLIQISSITKSFSPFYLFEGISLSIHESDVFALIGENGSGKTTLLQILTGQVMPDSGGIQKVQDLSMGYLSQEVSFENPNSTLREYLEEGKLKQLEQAMAETLERSEGLDTWADLHEEFERLGGYRRFPIEKALQGLKIEAIHLEAPLASLSNGQKVKAVLAKILIENPSLLLLDEPTNHLDADSIKWLKNHLRQRSGATVIVSHDRRFLNQTCNHTIEISQGKLTNYGGSYDYYLLEKEKQLQKQIKAFWAQEEELTELRQKIKSMTFSKKKAVQATDRNIMAYDRRGETHQKSQQRALDVLKERVVEIESNLLSHPMPKTIKGLRFEPIPLLSAVAIECDNISKAFGDKKVFSRLRHRLCKGDRIIVRGNNGSGKTTLLRCILGLLDIDEGNIRNAPSVRVSYLDQDVKGIPLNQTPVKYFEERFNLSEEGLRRELHKAALGGADLIRREFSTLSIGQRKRMLLLSLILEKPNVLLLDEPTNHLDLQTLEALEKALLTFEGAILAVSHDLTFIEKIGMDFWELG